MDSSNNLVDKQVVRSWLLWGFFWAVFAPFIGIILSLKFNYPTFLSNEYLHFGRLRPVHVNGVILGVFSAIFLGLVYYMVPKLAGIRMYKEEWSKYAVWLWNGTLIASFLSLLLGFNKGLEVAEFPNPLPLGLAGALFLIAYQVFMTIARRKEEKIYVSLWHIISALIWTGMNLLYGNLVLPYTAPGINNVALHGLYLPYVVGLWTLAFFYPCVGIHHYLYSRVPNWTQTIAIVSSMMLIIPVWTVVANFFGTLKGNWNKFQTDFTVKLMIFGAVMYFIGSTQGSLEALLSIQQPTHFTDFVIAHSHATVFGGYVIWVLAACYYVWPRVADGSFSVTTAAWSTWMIMGGISAMIFILIIQGLIQGTELMAGSEFVDSIVTMKPYWFIRTFTGITMDVGIALVGINLYVTSRGLPGVKA